MFHDYTIFSSVIANAGKPLVNARKHLHLSAIFHQRFAVENQIAFGFNNHLVHVRKVGVHPVLMRQFIITNPGSVYSEPILTVYGSGDITLMVGTTIVELEGISGSIVLDCALKEAYLGSTLMNDHMNGEFPVLKPGANAVTWNGTVTRVVVRPNWRFL